MNKYLYRIVFNKTRGQLMAVAEDVASDGKAPGTSRATKAPQRGAASAIAVAIRPLQYSMLLALGLVSVAAHAQIVADPHAPRTQQPTVLTTGNGVPLVNIQTPSAAGVSRNTYSQFDVNPNGTVLNNSRNSAQTQLGGWVQGNPWLAAGTARVILNEVNSSNPSLLRGYVEVAGDRAQVVIANPAGISCDGCGFINANRATLTTGSAVVNGGSLDSYRVQGGTVSISGAGLDASRTDFTDIIARSVQVNAGIWANTLKVTTGANEVSADHTQTTSIAASGAAPAYGLDVASLGGMYAGQITLVGTESGVGVRNAGQIGATAGDVVVTADGRLENSGRITASGAVHADTNGGMTNAGTVYAQGDTQLTTRGNVVNTGTIAAQGNTTVAATGAASTIDSQSGSLLGAGLRSDGTLGGSGTLALAATGELGAKGQNLASADLSASGAAIDLTGSQTAANNVNLTAGGGDIDSSRATVSATQTLAANASGTLRTDGAAVSADRLSFAAHDLSNVQGNVVQTGVSDLSIQLPGQFDNANGRIATNSDNLSIGAQTLTNTDGHIEHAGTGTLALNADTVNGARGSIGSNGALAMTSRAVTLDGGNTSASAIQVNAKTLSNHQGQLVQTGTGSASVVASTSLDNTGGTIAANGSMTVSAGRLSNQGGTIQAAGASSLNVTASGALDNSAQGKIVAGGDATVRAASLSNADGTVTGGGALDVHAAGALDNASGVLAANQNVWIGGGTIDNAGGQIGSVHGGTSVIAAAGSVGNANGRVEAAQTVTMAGNGIANADGVVSGGDVHLDSRTQSLDNTRGAIVAAGLLDVQSGRLTNDAGTLQAVDVLSIDTHGQTLSNTHSGATGGILGQSTVTLRTGDLDNTAGVIAAKGAISANGGQITNVQGGQITGEKTISLTGTGIDNRGGNLQALGKVTLDAGSGTVDNSGSLMRSGSALTVSAGRLINRGTQGENQGVEGQSVSVTADAIDNHAGAMRADTTLSITGSGTIDNSAGLISSGRSVQIQDRNLASRRQQVTNTGGTLIAAVVLGVNSAGLSGDGSVLSQGDMSVSLNGDFVNTGDVEANGNVTFQTTGQLTNRAAMRAGNTLTVGASNIDNTAAGEFSATTTKIGAGGTVTNRGLIDGQDTTVSSAVLDNVGTGRIYGDHLALSAGAIDNDVENGTAATIAARSRLDIAAQTLTNREHALIFSAGDMGIGGALDSSRFATGSAGTVNNNSASIEALGNLTLAAVNVNNTNEHFATDVQQQGGPEHIVEYEGDGSPNRYKPGDPDVYTYDDESQHLHTPEGNFESWHQYEYDRTTTATVITASDPSKMTSGGAMRIDASNVLNDKSQIIAGGALTGNIGNLNNTEVTGQKTVTDVGTATAIWRNHQKGRDSTGSSATSYAPPTAISDIRLTPTVYTEFTAPGSVGTNIGAVSVGAVRQTAAIAGAANVNVGDARVVAHVPRVVSVDAASTGQPFVIRSANVNTTVPNTSLFSVNPNPAGSFLIETDPRFANYRTWLSSDYMLQQLQVDPAQTQKRLGDGFYEQKLVREQVAQLTGRRFIDGYSSDEAEYRALIDSGVTYAKDWGLRPGVALTQAQMAQLTSDIVWLVEKDVTLPNGQTTKALVPQVYVRVKPGDLDGSGSLISGQTVALNLSGDLVNKGTIAGRDIVSLTAENVKNLGGRITGGDVAVRANTDLTNLGGTIDAANSLTATAGRDFTSTSTTHSEGNAQGTITNVSRVAGLYVTNPSGATLIAAAGHDLTLAGSQIGNASEGGQTTIAAGHDLTLSTVDTSSSQSLKWDDSNWRKDSETHEVGSSIQTAGDLRLSAGHDLNARGATVTSEQGALVATAGNDVNLTSAESTRNVDEAHRHKGTSSWFSSKTITTRNTLSETTNQATTFSGNTTYVQSGNDISVKGSNVVSTDATTLIAKHDVNIEAATDSTTERHSYGEKKTGLFGTGGIGFTIGMQQQSQDNRDAKTTASASTVGSTNGDIAISADNHYTQIGSNVVAPQGDIDIAAKKVDILAAQETSHSTQETQFKQSGLTVAVTAPVIAAIQTAEQMKRAAGETSDTRMKALAGATTALAGKNAADAVASDPKSGGGVSISITVGGSKSQSKTTEDATQVAGSKVAAGGNVSIQAIGAGQDSTLTVQGSDIKGGGDVTLKADGDIALLAANNTDEMHRTSSSISGGVGVAVSVNSNGASFGVTANASGSRGKGDGTDVAWTNTHVSAGNTLTLESGGDTTLRGAVASGKQVVADVGGNLDIESLQDTSVYHSKDQSIGGSVTVGYGFSASANVSQQKINSDFASVTEQSGIKAGDGGFQIDVKGNTDLKGGAIASSERAIADGVNSLTTATLTASDIQNHADYSASSFGIGGGYSYGGGGMTPTGGKGNPTAGGVGTNQQGQATTGGDKVPGSTVPTSGNWSATPPVVMSASGDGNSTTVSGISSGAIHVTDAANQQALTGKSADETVASVNRDVTTEHDGANALKPIFNEKEIQAGFEIVGALQRETGTFLANRAKEVDQKNAQAKEADAKASDMSNGLSDEERLALRDQAAALRDQAKAINDKWGAGGTYRQITMALMAGAGGNVTGSTAQFAQNMVVNYIQQQGASYIGKLVEDGKLEEGSPLHAALHGIVACAGAAASNQSCSAGALGAAASSVLTGLFSETSPDETASQREGKRNLITSLVTGIAAMSGADTTAATNGAVAAVDNNWLATQQIVQMKKEVANAKTVLEQFKVASKWAYVSTKQDVLTSTGIGKGLAEAGWNDVKGVAEFMAHPIEGLNGLKQLISSPDARQQLGDALFKELDAKIDRMSEAINEGGDANAEQLGQDLGGLLWQVGSVVTGAGGVAKGATALASVGVRIGTDVAEALSGAAKFDRLLANGGLFAADGKPLMDFRSLTNAQKSVVGEMMGGEKVKQLLPGGEKIGRSPGIGETGIDDLYKVNKPGVDYVIVEYKFGSSKLGSTADGLQMSDDWLTGVNTNYNRIDESVGSAEGSNVRAALDSNRVEKWLVHTDQFGRVTVGVLNGDGKLIPHPELVSGILGGGK